MALVSPLLPARSGIAEFVSALLPHLARRFEVDLYVEARADPERYRDAGHAVHDWRQLPARASVYDAGVVYAMGNSDHHTHMLALLDRVPGTVLLHDAVLSDLMWHAGSSIAVMRGFFLAMLHYCHGERALEAHRAEGAEATLRSRCMARWVADRATGVVVTSSHARDLLQDQGQVGRDRCVVVPLNCEPRSDNGTERERARRALGIDDDLVLLCTFGVGHERKHWRELIDAWSLGERPRPARLVFVGEPQGAYSEAQVRRGRAFAGRDAIVFTGYVDDVTFHRYMRASDVVVQLRSESRGESSGAAIFAMSYGKPLVVTDHGSLGDLPDDCCAKLPLPIDARRLSALLDDLVVDAGRRAALGSAALRWVADHCDPARVAEAIADAIVRFNGTAIVRSDGRPAERAATAISAALARWVAVAPPGRL